MGRIISMASAAIVVLVTGVTSGAAATPVPPPSKADFARQLLGTVGPYLTGPDRQMLELVAGSDTSSFAGAAIGSSTTPPSSPAPATGTGLPNVRVNDPAEDSHQVDQTTQHDPAIAVAGTNVVVGFFDSQQFQPPFLHAGVNLVGVARSSDGGHTFTDGGVIRNPPGMYNFGIPSVAADSAKNLYYSNDAYDYADFKTEPRVSKSTDGGQTWRASVDAAKSVDDNVFWYFDFTSSMTVSGNTLYETWTDSTIQGGGFFNGANLSGLAIGKSIDGGSTWKVTYASQKPFLSSTSTCSTQVNFIDSPHLAVAPDGTLSVAARNFAYCAVGSGSFTENLVIFSSRDGGATWMQGASLPVVSSTQGRFAFGLGVGKLMVNQELPAMAFANGALYLGWNDGGDGSGHSHIKLARSTDGGQTWSTSYITSGTNDEVQPSMVGDASGLHILYYQIRGATAGCWFCPGISSGGEDTGPQAQLDAMVADTTDGATWSTTRVSNQSSPGLLTSPPFDPAVPTGRMGDVTAITSDGTHRYFAWTDNRDIVTNGFWTAGRHDSDIYFAKQ